MGLLNLMKAGDMVRFVAPHWLWHKPVSRDLSDRPTLIGLLVSYEKWEKIAEVLYEGEILRVAARNVEKCGKNMRKEIKRK